MAAFIGRCIQDIPATSSRTVTTHFIYRATTKYSWAFEHTKTVKMMYIDREGHIPLWLTMMDGQQSLTLNWRSFSRWGREHFSFSCSCKDGQYFVSDCLHPLIPQITQDTRPTFVDPPLTLNSKMGQHGYCNLFYLYRRPMIPLSQSATYRHYNYAGHLTNNRWHSVDAHCQDQAGSMSVKFYQYRRPILRFCKTMTKSMFNYQTYMT